MTSVMAANTLYAQFHLDKLRMFPSLASFQGDRSADDKFEIAIAPAFRKQWLNVVARYQRALLQQGINTIEDRVLDAITHMEMAGSDFDFDLMPIDSFSNPLSSFRLLEDSVYPRSGKQASFDRAKRRVAYTQYIDQCVSNMKIGVTKGFTLPKRICKHVIQDLEHETKDKNAIVGAPCITRLLNYLQNEYLPACRDSIGLSQIPGGRDMYKYLVRKHTTLDLTPEDIHELGKKEVKRIISEFERLRPSLQNKLPFACKLTETNIGNFLSLAQNNRAFRFSNEAELLDAFKHKISMLRRTIVKANFHRSVKGCDVVKVPGHMQTSSAGAFYIPGDHSRKGQFFINARNVSEHATYTTEALSIHEAEPGHHYQFQYMLDIGLPLHRVFGCESTGFVEGWALYAESLSQSMDPYDHFGRLSYEIFRAVRCVVDTGIHYFGWSFQKALHYMVKRVPLQKSEIVTELERYICIPGQAVSYKVGEMFFQQERESYLKHHPGKNIKDFHQSCLQHGVLPLLVLKQLLANQA